MCQNVDNFFKIEYYFAYVPQILQENTSLIFFLHNLHDILEKNIIHSNQPAYLDKHSTIKNSYIGKNCKLYENIMVRDSIICDNVTIGHSSEVVRSIIFPNVEISHFVFIGDSLIGNNVMFGASTLYILKLRI